MHLLRKSLFVVLAVPLGLALAVPRSYAAQTLYQTGFERPIFHDGDLLVGLDGWTGAVPPPPFSLNPQAARITADEASRGSQSVEVHGEDLVASGGNTPPYDAVGSYRRPLNYTVSPNTVVRMEADLLLDTDQPKTEGEFFSLTVAARSGDGETLGEIGLSSAGIVEAFGFDVPPGSSPAFTKHLSLNQWHHVTMRLDYAHRTTAYFIDGHFLGTINTPSTSNVLLRGAMVVYARPDGDSTGRKNRISTRSSYTAYFDNFRVSVGQRADDD